MDLQNLAYALVQVIHNFGATAVTGGAVFALWPGKQTQEIQMRLAWLVMAGWAMQGASGAGFGAISFYYYGKPPDIHGIAIAALVIKMSCAVLGFAGAVSYILKSVSWSDQKRNRAWRMLTGIAAIALSAAAFLRWFS